MPYLNNPIRMTETRSRVKRRMFRLSTSLTYVICPVCGELYDPDGMDLHEIVPRHQIVNKVTLNLLPVELHVLVCQKCHTPWLHGEEGRIKMFKYAIELWGQAQVRLAVRDFNKHLVTPLSSSIIPYELLGE